MKKLNTSPLEVEFDDQTNELYLNGEKLEPAVRRISEMRDVIADNQFLFHASPEQALYFMYRNIWREQDDYAYSGVGYDVTVILPTPLGKEFNKTLGHYHAVAENSRAGHTFPEVYEVLQGKAVYVLQKLAETNDCTKASGEISDFIAIEAGEGDKTVIPPDYGHVSVNASTTQALVMSNVPDGSVGKGDYSLFKKRHGAVYYFFSDGSVVPNSSYENPPELKRFKASNWPANEKIAELKENLYAAFLHAPNKFEWLLAPDLFYEL